MKQVTIRAKATIVVVDVPEDIMRALRENKEFIVSQSKEYAHIYTSSTDIIPADYKVVLLLIRLGILECDGGNYDLKTRNYQFNAQNFRIAGSPSQLPEEDWNRIVDKVDWYYNYLHKVQTRRHMFYTATESGLSLLKANGVVMGNPLGTNDDTGHNARDREWQQAQEQVWLNPQIFVKI